LIATSYLPKDSNINKSLRYEVKGGYGGCIRRKQILLKDFIQKNTSILQFKLHLL